MKVRPLSKSGRSELIVGERHSASDHHQLDHSEGAHLQHLTAPTMSTWSSYFGLGGKGRTNQDTARDAIVELRQQLLLLDKKEEHLNKRIEEETRKAKANATSNKRGTSLPPHTPSGASAGIALAAGPGARLRILQLTHFAPLSLAYDLCLYCRPLSRAQLMSLPRRSCTYSSASRWTLIVAMAALRQKKFYENELDSLAGTRMTLESQVSNAKRGLTPDRQTYADVGVAWAGQHNRERQLAPADDEDDGERRQGSCLDPEEHVRCPSCQP